MGFRSRPSRRSTGNEHPEMSPRASSQSLQAASKLILDPPLGLRHLGRFGLDVLDDARQRPVEFADFGNQQRVIHLAAAGAG